MCFVYFEVKVWYKMSWRKKNSCFCFMLTFLRCPLITENKHLLRDPELSSVTRNCQIYIMPLDTLKIGIYKLKDFRNFIKVMRNNLLNSIYSSVSPDFRFKETPYVNFFTDPELSSSLYHIAKLNACTLYASVGRCFRTLPLYTQTHFRRPKFHFDSVGLIRNVKLRNFNTTSMYFYKTSLNGFLEFSYL